MALHLIFVLFDTNITKANKYEAVIGRKRLNKFKIIKAACFIVRDVFFITYNFKN
jgi:hypothetical protein